MHIHQSDPPQTQTRIQTKFPRIKTSVLPIRTAISSTIATLVSCFKDRSEANKGISGKQVNGHKPNCQAGKRTVFAWFYTAASAGWAALYQDHGGESRLL